MHRYALSVRATIRAASFTIVLLLPALLAACGQGNGGGAGY
jgi:hypothetical protein